MQKACDAFNAKHAVGDTITVFTGVVGENPQLAQVRYPAQILSGHTAVVYTTIGGCIALTHVRPAEQRAAA